MNNLFWCLTIFGFSVAFAQYPINGTCPESCKVCPLNVTASELSGIWFVQYSIPYPFEAGTKCTYTNTTTTGPNSLYFSKIWTFESSNTQSSINGTTVFNSTGESFHQYILDGTVVSLELTSKLIAVNSDYVIEIACHDCGLFSKAGAGLYTKIYTRVQFPSSKLLAAAIDILVSCGIPESALIKQNQNCVMC